MIRFFLIIFIGMFYSSISRAQSIVVTSHADSLAWNTARILQTQLKCTDSQFYRIYEADRIRLGQLDSVNTLLLPRDQQAGSMFNVKHLFYANLKAILSAAQWEQFRSAEIKRRDAAIERLKKRGIPVQGLPHEDIN